MSTQTQERGELWEEIVENTDGELPVIMLEVRGGGTPSQRRLTEEKRRGERKRDKGGRTETDSETEQNRTAEVATYPITYVHYTISQRFGLNRLIIVLKTFKYRLTVQIGQRVNSEMNQQNSFFH